MSAPGGRIPRRAPAPTTSVITSNNADATTAAAATHATTANTAVTANVQGSGKRKRSVAGQEKRNLRKARYVPPHSNEVQQLKAALQASQREAADQRAAAQRSEQQRRWAVEASTENCMACVHMQSDLKEAEDLALDYMSKYERADQQRTELYYQAKSSNALAAKTLMDSLSGGDGEGCKALVKQRKVRVVAQAKELRLTVKPHLAAAAKAVQGHKPFARPSN